MKIFRSAALVINVVVLGISVFLFFSAYAEEKFIALLFAIVPIVNILGMYDDFTGEERRLAKKVRLLKLRKELEELESVNIHSVKVAENRGA